MKSGNTLPIMQESVNSIPPKTNKTYITNADKFRQIDSPCPHQVNGCTSQVTVPNTFKTPHRYSWRERTYEDGTSVIPCQDSESFNRESKAALRASRLDFSSFINSMDDMSFAYFSLIREYASRPLQDNSLQYQGLYKALVFQKPDDEQRTRCSVVEFESNRSRSTTLSSFDELEAYYLNSRPEDTPQRRLFVLEDLPVKSVCFLGSRLKIHPSVFASHYTLEDNSTRLDNRMQLPSEQPRYGVNEPKSASSNNQLGTNEARRLSLRYPVAMPRVSATQHPDHRFCPPWLKPSPQLMGQSAYANFIIERMIDTPTKHDEWDARGEISELESQVTYWTRRRGSEGWDVLLLVDPCIQDPAHLAMIKGAAPPDLRRIIRYPELGEQGKADIDSNPLNWHPGNPSTKYILHDDILAHFDSAISGPSNDPFTVTPFVRDFVISKWVVHLDHVRRCWAQTRGALFSSGNFSINDEKELAHYRTRWGSDWKEWIFEEMTFFTTNLVLCHQDVELNMRALGIDVNDSKSYGFVGGQEAQRWHFLRTSCMELEHMFQNRANSYTQVVALSEAQASNLQAKSVQWLTCLGTLFVPMSVVVGILSMDGDFLPGQSRFWIYVAVVIPLLLVTATLMWSFMVRAKLRQFGKASRAEH